MLANGGWDLIRAANNASKWRMGFNSAFKGLNNKIAHTVNSITSGSYLKGSMHIANGFIIFADLYRLTSNISAAYPNKTDANHMSRLTA